MRLVVLAALAVLTASPALARHYTIALNGYCNVGVVSTAPPNGILVYKETQGQSCENVIGTGFKLSGTYDGVDGKWAAVGQINFSYPNEQETQLFQYPFVTGGKWVLYGTTDGKNLIIINSGTYSVLNNEDAGHRSGMPASRRFAL